MARRDPDIAVADVVRTVQDWSGGTRITASLHEFNRRWARRVLPGNGTVLLISDGLERADSQAMQALGDEMAQLSRSCRRLIWLNPLLRYADFQPRAAGVCAMLPHVDAFVPAHNVESLTELVASLGQASGRQPPRAIPQRPPEARR